MGRWGQREIDVYFKSDTYTRALYFTEFLSQTCGATWVVVVKTEREHFHCKFFHMLTIYLAMTKHTSSKLNKANNNDMN